MASIPAPLHRPTATNHMTPRRLSGAASFGTSVRLPANIVTHDTVYPMSTAAYGSGHSARPPFTAACAPPRIAAPASGSRIAHAAHARVSFPPRAVNATTPSTIAAVPTAAASVSGSLKKPIATSTANRGVVLDTVPAIVGPVRRFEAKLSQIGRESSREKE